MTKQEVERKLEQANKKIEELEVRLLTKKLSEALATIKDLEDEIDGNVKVPVLDTRHLTVEEIRARNKEIGQRIKKRAATANGLSQPSFEDQVELAQNQADAFSGQLDIDFGNSCTFETPEIAALVNIIRKE